MSVIQQNNKKKSSLQHNQYNNTGSINNLGKTKQPVRKHKQSKVLEKKKKVGGANCDKKTPRQNHVKQTEKKTKSAYI